VSDTSRQKAALVCSGWRWRAAEGQARGARRYRGVGVKAQRGGGGGSEAPAALKTWRMARNALLNAAAASKRANSMRNCCRCGAARHALGCAKGVARRWSVAVFVAAASRRRERVLALGGKRRQPAKNYGGERRNGVVAWRGSGGAARKSISRGAAAQRRHRP
jgi:hypothetical protein